MEQATEYERLNRALSIYRDAMRRHIREVLDDDPPDVDPESDWFMRKVVAKLPEPQRQDALQTRSKSTPGTSDWQGENQLDIPHFLFAVKDNPGFRDLAEQSTLYLIRDIYDIRNRWAHPPLSGFHKAEVDRAVLKCADIVAEFDEEAAAELRSLSTQELELAAATDAVAAIGEILRGIEELKANVLPREAMDDLVRGATDLTQVKARLERLESEQRAERESRERQLGEIAETLERLLEAQSEPRPPLVDEILGAERVENLKQSLRRLQGG